MDEATRICALLLRQGTAERAALPELDFPEVRRAVEERLAAVGLVLATSAYSEHVGLRLSPDVTADSAFDAASNLGLHSDECALLVILWARLVLQKRTAADTRELPGQGALFAGERGEAARRYVPQVRLETLAREFASVLGSRTRIKQLVTRLRNLGFVAGRGEMIEPGPLLELGIDGERMVGFIRREVLAKLVAEKEAAAAAPEATDAVSARRAAVLTLLAAARPDGLSIGELAEGTGERRDNLRPLLRQLLDEQVVERRGERRATRYHKLEP